MFQSRLAAPVVAFLAPLLLYGGALVSQFGFGLHPCEMCYWQRWPHQAAMVLAALALLLRRNDAAMRTLTLLAAVAIAISGAIGIFHAGVEYGFWEGLTTCSTGQSGPIPIDKIVSATATFGLFFVPNHCSCALSAWVLSYFVLVEFMAFGKLWPAQSAIMGALKAIPRPEPLPPEWLCGFLNLPHGPCPPNTVDYMAQASYTLSSCGPLCPGQPEPPKCIHVAGFVS